MMVSNPLHGGSFLLILSVFRWLSYQDLVGPAAGSGVFCQFLSGPIADVDNPVQFRIGHALPPTTQQTERLHLSLQQNTRADRIAGMADHHVVNVEVSFAGISAAPFGRASLDCRLPVRRGQLVVKHFCFLSWWVWCGEP